MTTHPVLCLLRISRTVTDLAQATAFYCDALDFHATHQATFSNATWGELMGVASLRVASVRMRLGAQEIELLAFDPPGMRYPASSSSTDLWFQHIAIVVSDMDAAYQKLRRHSFEPISAGGPQQLPPQSGSVIAYKFRDPDGHPLELIQFPAGSGAPVWQQQEALFLGIDHSAIDVGDLEQSLDFYTNALGFRVVSRSINSGPAQQRLDSAQDDLVDVLALRPVNAGPPHIELLAYRNPKGRRIPQSARSDDIFADRLVLQVGDLTALNKSLHARNVEFVSPRVVTASAGHQALLIRDPTGHLLLLTT